MVGSRLDLTAFLVEDDFANSIGLLNEECLHGSKCQLIISNRVCLVGASGPNLNRSGEVHIIDVIVAGIGIANVVPILVGTIATVMCFKICGNIIDVDKFCNTSSISGQGHGTGLVRAENITLASFKFTVIDILPA